MVIDYLGPHPAAVITLHEYVKLFDGSIRFTGSMDEDDIREEIVRAVSSKELVTHDLHSLLPSDFIFIKCSNKRVRVPDGDVPFDVVHTHMAPFM